MFQPPNPLIISWEEEEENKERPEDEERDKSEEEEEEAKEEGVRVDVEEGREGDVVSVIDVLLWD